jgi:hypothetical protein
LAALSVELGISPKDLIELDAEMLEAIVQVLKDRAKGYKDATARAAQGRRR